MSKNEQATKALALRKDFEGRIDKARSLIAPTLPDGVDFDKMRHMAVLEIQANHNLANAQPLSVFWGFVHATSLGLSVSRVAEEASLIPFREKQKDGTWIEKAQLVIQYKGLTKLAYQHPKIIDINTQAVFEGDYFEVDLGSEPRIIFRPDYEGDRNVFLAAFCIVRVQARQNQVGKIMQVMSKAEIDKVRAASKNKDGLPWKNWYEEMARKTVLKRTLKTVPRSSDLNLDRAIQLEAAYDIGERPDGEIEVVEVVDKPRGRAAKARASVAQQAADVPVVDGQLDDDEPTSPDPSFG